VNDKQKTWFRHGVDYAAPLAFLVSYFVTRDMLIATGVLTAVSALALIAGLVVERRLAPLPAFMCISGIVFGGLTLIFHDTRFIKIKATAINGALGALLLGGLALGKNPLKLLLGEALKMPDEGWRKLGLRYGMFYFFLACLNEVVWRLHPISTLAIQQGWNLGLDPAGDAEWVLFRMPGLHILTVIFGLSQLPLLMRYIEVKDEAEVAKEVDAAAPPTVG
jgi:intracellular septation protein